MKKRDEVGVKLPVLLTLSLKEYAMLKKVCDDECRSKANYVKALVTSDLRRREEEDGRGN